MISERKNVLVVLDATDSLAWKSLRNADGVHLLTQEQLNAYDVLISDDVVFTSASLDAFIERSAKTLSKRGAVDSAGVVDDAEPAPEVEVAEAPATPDQTDAETAGVGDDGVAGGVS